MVAAMDLAEFLRDLGFSSDTARRLEFVLLSPARIVLVLVGALVISRIATRWIRRSMRSIQGRAQVLALSPRAEQRATTIAEALASLARALIWGVAVLLVLDQLGLNLAPLLAGAGIAGVAIGFGAQTLVRDFIAGIFILVEDQYGVGDTVQLGDTSGTVEDVNLRVTRLRGGDGTVWFVPNGEIRKVGNTSLEWAQATVDVPVPVDTDPEAARRALEEEAAAFAAEEDWAPLLVQPPTVLGLEDLAVDHGTLRVTVRTPPGQHQKVARALRSRLSRRLRVVATATGGSGPADAEPPPGAGDERP